MPITSILRKILDEDSQIYSVKGQYVGSFTLESGHDTMYKLRMSKTNSTFTILYLLKYTSSLSFDAIARHITTANANCSTGFYRCEQTGVDVMLHYLQTIWIDRNPTRESLDELMSLGKLELGHLLYSLHLLQHGEESHGAE